MVTKIVFRTALAFLLLQTRLESSTWASEASPCCEVRTAPIAFLASWYTLDVSLRLSNRWSLGPSVTLYNASGYNMFLPADKGYSAGAHLTYHFKTSLESSPYVGVHIYYDKYNSFVHPYNGHLEHEGFQISPVLGYQWKFGLFVMRAGGGVLYRHHHIIDRLYTQQMEEYPEISSFTTGWLTPFHIEFKIGLAF